MRKKIIVPAPDLKLSRFLSVSLLLVKSGHNDMAPVMSGDTLMGQQGVQQWGFGVQGYGVR